MTEFIDIWLFLERKFETLIPPYIKNVLKYCGYEDCHTIATIEEHDLEYFIAEVRKGGITNFFAKTGLENALQDSNKSEENFEFRRGHQKLLMAIVKFVKKNLNENGVDAFSVKLPKSLENLNVAAKTANKSQTEKDTSISTRELTLAVTRKDFVHEELIDLQATLLKQTIRSLFTYSSEMYDKNMELIGTKICNGLVYITTEKIKPLYSAGIKCPYCAENITVSHILNESSWDTENFDSHLSIAHNKNDETLKNKIVAHELIPTGSNFGDDLNRDVKVEVPITLNSICLPSLAPILGYSDCDTNIEDNEGKSILHFGMSDIFHEDKIVDNDKIDNNVVVVKKEDYVICSVTKKSSVKWPDCVPKATYFVGQILRLNGLADGEVELQIFKRNHDSKFIFACVIKGGIHGISVKNIVKILEAPTRNRRNKLVFRDKTLLQYNI